MTEDKLIAAKKSLSTGGYLKFKTQEHLLIWLKAMIIFSVKYVWLVFRNLQTFMFLKLYWQQFVFLIFYHAFFY